MEDIIKIDGAFKIGLRVQLSNYFLVMCKVKILTLSLFVLKSKKPFGLRL